MRERENKNLMNFPTKSRIEAKKRGKIKKKNVCTLFVTEYFVQK